MGDADCAVKIKIFKGRKIYTDDTIGEKAQTTIEFVFAMMIVLLMIYGLIMIFRWAGVGIVEREKMHERTLTAPLPTEDWGTLRQGPLNQIDPQFYQMRKMHAVFGE